VSEVTLDNQGNFGFRAGLSSPLPVGGVRITANTQVSGRGRPNPNPLLPPIPRDQQISLAGNGTVLLPNGQQFAAAVSYSTSDKVLAFQADATNLGLALGKHVALFGAGAGFKLGGIGVDGVKLTDGEMTFQGSAGLLRNDKPPKDAAKASPEDFYLIAQNVQARFAFDPAGFDLSLANGTLQLPEIFTAGLCDTNHPRSTDKPLIQISQPIKVRFDLASAAPGGIPAIAAVTFSGALGLHDIGLKVPALPGLGAEICDGTLEFPRVALTSDALRIEQLPLVKIGLGKLQVPLPPGQTNRADIVNAVWALDGFPTGEIVLQSDIKMLDQSGFTFTLLGQEKCSDGTATDLIITRQGPDGPPKIILDGAIQFGAPLDTLTTVEGDQVKGKGCGTLILYGPPTLPEFHIRELSVGGTFHLGGTNGLLVQNAQLDFINPENLLHLDADHKTIIKLDGSFGLPNNGPALSMTDAKFTFFDQNRLPAFTVSSLAYDNRGFQLVPNLPAQVSKASLAFKNPEAPLPALFNPTNITVGLSAKVALPSFEQPFVSGQVDDIAVTVTSAGFLQIQAVDGFGMEINIPKIPPLEDVGGRVYVGNLSDPANITFTGKVGASYEGYKLKMLIAFNLAGMIGECLDVNAGAVGIPIAQTGFLITGASGGMAFLNSNGDPCDFANYMTPEGKPKPAIIQLPLGLTWQNLLALKQRFEQLVQAYAPAMGPVAARRVALETIRGSSAASALDAAAELQIPCPGDCPPPTVNIFCQPHPDQTRFPNKIILKFTSVDEETLNRIGITRDWVSQQVSSGGDIAVQAGTVIRFMVDQLTPKADPSLLGQARADKINAVITQVLNDLQAEATRLIREKIAGQTTADAIYDKLKEAAYAGISCPDVTMQVSGTFSHLAVSSFLSATGQGILSTAGSAGVVGKVNLFGIPVGTGEVFVAATDKQGLPNPSLCGDINVAFGPLDLGSLKASLNCDNCVTGVLSVFGQLAGSLSVDLVNNILAKVAPEFQGKSPQELVALLSAQQKAGFMAELFQIPAAALPPDLPQRLVTALGAAFDQINPQLLMCGQVRPKLFGLPLMPDVVAVSARETKNTFDANVRFSPSFLLALILDPRFFPPVDTATLGYSYFQPDPAQILLAGLSGRLSSPAAIQQFAEEQFLQVLQNNAMTIAYELSPLGLKLGRAQARVVNPDLISHPVVRVPVWKPPEEVGLPSRLDLLEAAVRADLLGNSLWKGNSNDLFTVFPDDTRKNQTRGLSLIHDYFPHGGFIGAGYLDVPKALYEPVPNEFYVMVSPTNSPLVRLGAAITYVSEYVLKNTEAGTLGFYLPAPNPPTFVDSTGRPLSPLQLLESIRHFDVKDLHAGSLYPFEQSFLLGHLNGQLLGVPIGEAKVVGLPADPAKGRAESILQVTAQVPIDSGLHAFIPQANFIFEMRQAPPQPIEVWASNAVVRLNNLQASGPSAEAARLAVDQLLAEVNSNMPKVKLESDVTLQIPPELSAFIGVNVTSSGNAKFVAYSPAYDPAALGDGPFAEAKRRGGIALRADATLGGLFSIPQAEFFMLPQGNALPLLSGRFNLASANLPGGITFQNVKVDFNSAPVAGQASLAASGVMSAVRVLPYLDIMPRVTGQNLTGRVEVVKNSSGLPTTRLSLDPARIYFPYFDPAKAVYIDGGAATTPFTFSTDPNQQWNARVTFQDYISLGVGGVELLRYSGSSLSGGVTNKGLASGSITVAIDSSQQLQILPFSSTYARSITFEGSSGLLTVSSDGSFQLKGRLGQGLTFAAAGGVPEVQIAAGADVVMTGQQIRFTIGGTSAGPFPGSTAQGTLVLDYSNLPNVTASLSSTITMDPLVTGIFKIVPAEASATKLTALMTNSVITLSGAKLKLDGVVTNEILLPPLTLDVNGNFQKLIGPVDLAVPLQNSVAPFLLSNAQFNLKRTSATVGVFDFSADLTLPGFSTAGRPHLTAAAIDSTGQFSLTAGGGITLSLTSWPVTSAGLTAVTLSRVLVGTTYQTTLNAQGTFSGGVIPAGAITTSSSLAFSTTGLASISAAVQIPNWTLGKFSIKRADGKNLGATLSGAGLSIEPATVSLAFDNYVMGNFTLPSSALASAGAGSRVGLAAYRPQYLISGNDFNFGASSSAFSLFGYDLGAVSFSFGRTGQAVFLAIQASSLALPGFLDANKVPIRVNATGTILSDGSVQDGRFTLQSAAGLSLSFVKKSINDLANGVAALKRSGAGVTSLALSGNFSGGALSGLGLPGGTAGLQVQLAADGTQTIQGQLTIAPVQAGLMRIEPVAGGSFTATLNNTSLQFTTDARLVIDRLFAAPIGLARPVLSSSGAFSQAVNVASLQVLGINFGSGNFTLNRSSAGALSLDPVQLSLTVPGIGQTLSFSGNIQQDGTTTLVNSIGSAIPVLGFNAVGANTFLAGPSFYSSLVKGRSPEAYWRLGDGVEFVSGRISYPVKDEMGLHSLSLSPFVLQPDRSQLGALLPMDDNASFKFAAGKVLAIPMAQEPSFDITGPLTVEAWIKVNALNAAYQSIATKGDSAWRVQRNGNANSLSFDTDGLNPPYLAGSKNVNDGQWHHVAAVYDGKNKFLFIDGAVDAWTRVTGSIALNDFPVMIGDNAQATGRPWDGWIDEVAIYKSALQPDQIANDFQAGKGTALSSSLRLQILSLGSVNLNGSISPGGQIDLRADNAAFAMAGFSGNSGSLWLRNGGGLKASGSFGFNVLGSSGNLFLDGTIDSPATFNLYASGGGTLKFGNYSVTIPANGVVLKSSGLSQNGTANQLTLPGTSATVSIGSLQVTSSGLQSLSASYGADSQWQYFGTWTDAFGKVHKIHPFYRFKGSVNFSVSSNAIKGSATGTFGAWFDPGNDPADGDFDTMSSSDFIFPKFTVKESLGTGVPVSDFGDFNWNRVSFPPSNTDSNDPARTLFPFNLW